jgi:hypothetical protein
VATYLHEARLPEAMGNPALTTEVQPAKQTTQKGKFMTSRIISAACGIAAVTAAGLCGSMQSAQAGIGTLTLSGIVDGTDDGVPFTGAAFTMVGDIFSVFVPPNSGYEVFPSSTVTFTIAGIGTAAPIGPYTPVTIGPPTNPGLGTYGVTFSLGSGDINEFFDTMVTYQVPGFQETDYSNATAAQTQGTINLTVGDDSVVLTNFESLDPTATLLVPEPGSMLALGPALAAMLRLKRNRQPKA